ncbi:MAG: sulfatase-like hydrolase/transferase [Myxococcota bacterium]
MRPRSSTGVVGLALVLLLLGSGCSRDGKVALAEQHIYAANTYLSEGKLAKALGELQQAAEIAPHHLPIYLQMGVAYSRGGQYAKAIQKFRYVLEHDPKNAKAYELWGATLLRQGRMAQAARRYEKAAELDPTQPQVFRQWGAVLVRLRRNAEAVRVLEKAAELKPDLPAEALANWGTALHHLGKHEEAIARYEEALELDPENFTAMNNLGLLLVRDPSERARKRGIRLLEGALKKRPGSPGTLHNLGWAYLETGRTQEAYALLQRALAATDAADPAYEERRNTLERAEAGLPRASARRDMPNVLLVVIDTLRADHLSSYGYSRKTSPHIDELASESVVFTNAVSQAPWTAASIASLLTGLYPSVHGLDGGIRWGAGQRTAGGKLPFAIQKTLSSTQLTLAEMLRRRGYRTAGFVSNVYVNSIFGFSLGFETYDDEHEDYSRDVGHAKRRGEDTNAHVFEWLDGKPQEPFFLLVHYNDCHWPYIPPEPHGREYVEGYTGSLTPENTGTVVEKQGKPITGLSQEDLQYIIGLYDGEIHYADENVGRLLERIEKAGFERELLTVLTADHGEEFLDHGSASHGYTLYEEQIHVPLIVRHPGHLKPRRVDAQVRLIDVLPTILALAGVELDAAARVQGTSLLPLLEGRTTQGVREAFSEATYVGAKKSLRSDTGKKLIYSFAGEGAMLFDLKSDPHERRNLLDEKPELAAPLQENLELWVQANQATRVALFGGEGPDQEIVLDAETQERLKALGYIQ